MRDILINSYHTSRYLHIKWRSVESCGEQLISSLLSCKANFISGLSLAVSLRGKYICIILTTAHTASISSIYTGLWYCICSTCLFYKYMYIHRQAVEPSVSIGRLRFWRWRGIRMCDIISFCVIWRHTQGWFQQGRRGVTPLAKYDPPQEL